MDFVTISDHNCIDGALEIAHLPGAFVSNEITTYFPDDGCKVHVLCWNITEAQFDEIQRLRENIVELRDYLHTQAHRARLRASAVRHQRPADDRSLRTAAASCSTSSRR